MEVKKDIAGKKILIIGELLADMISEGNIESLASPSLFVINQGGSAANLCANLKWLGMETSLVATVGNDNIGNFLLEELNTLGISNRYIARSENCPTSIVLIGKNETMPDFISYRCADMVINYVDANLLEECELIHTTAFALSKEPARTTILDVFKKGHQMGKLLSIDWNYAPSIWHNDDGCAVFEQLRMLNPLLKISIDDLTRYLYKNLNIEECKLWLDKQQIDTICLTCGKDGVWFKTSNQNWLHQTALPVESVIGTTGAGDAFWAGFLAYFSQNKSIVESVAHALFIAKLKIETPYPLYKNKLSFIHKN